MLLFAAGTQGYFFARNKAWEAVALLLIAFTLFRPGFWLDMVEEPFRSVDPTRVVELAGELPDNGELRLVIAGPDFNTGETAETTLILPLGPAGDGAQRLQDADLPVMIEDGVARLDEPFRPGPAGSVPGQKLADFDFYADNPVRIAEIHVAVERLPKEIFYIPALLLLGLVIVLQRRRTDVPAF
jgi:hypothetical protein